MCGIWALIFENKDLIQQLSYYLAFNKIHERGPDQSEFIEFNDINLKVGFHRLRVMDPSVNGDQPFITQKDNKIIITMCNGEIYNYKQLIKKYGYVMKSNSDCEIIHHIYMNNDIKQVFSDIRGEFSLLIIEINKINNEIKVFAGSDPFAIRPLYYYFDQEKKYLNFSSEQKGLIPVYHKLGKPVFKIPQGSYIKFIKKNNKFHDSEQVDYYQYPEINIDGKQYPEIPNNIPELQKLIRDTFTKCVVDRLHADREIGCLLSGGLDSSLVCAIASDYLKKHSKKLHTFSIGIDGESTDEKYARIVSEYIGSIHTHFDVSSSECLAELENVIHHIETYDVTTIRASTMQYLLVKKIKETTNITVLLCGDGSDEVCAGYMYFHKAPTPEESHYENIKLLSNISNFDVRRAEMTISRNGLEGRVPFLDVRFVELYLKIKPSLRIPRNDDPNKKPIEKWLLRDSFRESKILPESVLFRKKEAFSDGVSSEKKSWYQIIQEHVDTNFNEELDKIYQDKAFDINTPKTKEARYFRYVYEKHFGEHVDEIIPYYWLPKWCGDIHEPSARVLQVYSEN